MGGERVFFFPERTNGSWVDDDDDDGGGDDGYGLASCVGW